MFKKQIYKLLLSGLIALVFFGILPVFAFKAQAQPVPSPSPGGGQIDPQGPSPACKVTTSNFTSSKLDISNATVRSDEPFDVYFEANISSALASQCATSGKDDYAISIYLYNDDWGTTISSLLGSYNYQITYKVDLNGQQFRQKIKGLTLRKVFEGSSLDSGGYDLKMYAYWHKRSEEPSNSEYIPSGGVSMHQDNPVPPIDHNPPTGPNPFYPDVPGISANDTLINNNVEKAKADELSVTIKPDSSGKGLRSKYRVALTDTAITFGSQNGPDAIYADWAEGSKRIGLNQYIGVPYDSKGTLVYDYSVQFKNVQMYFTDGTKAWDVKQKCWKDSANYFFKADDDCSMIVYVNDAKGVGSDPSKGTKGLLAGTFDPTMKAGIWSQFSGKTAAAGQALGSTDLYVIPIAWGNQGATGGYKRTYVLGKGGLQKVTIEVFKTDDDIKLACKNDPAITNKADCDNLQFAKFGFASTVTQTTASSETKDAGAAQTLYAFIVRIISSIIVWIQSLLYRIFAYIIVPVLKAILAVRPYQDTFVNIIYPGWLILRNLANIFFIVALLVVGLRILFQQSNSSTARGFILRLVIMALLVNFSLVIAQGVVGIADTVQAQFLPKDSRVIEALGSKLMVEPLLAFRSEVNNNTDGGAFTSDTAEVSLADTVKPIVLLFLSIAAFLSFMVLAAFLLVRLVALWVLYMTSPIAYVGYVMDETQGYASKWWKEFIKYVMITPVLAFFLNIAALMATQFSGSNNKLFEFNEEGSLSSDIVIGSLTIVTHFIVLGVIYAGMKYAQDSGVVGAKQITGWAKKAFEWTAGAIPKAGKAAGVWTKDAGADYLASKTKSPGLQKAIRSAARPIEAAKALKKGYFDIPKERMNSRFTDSFAGLTHTGLKYGDEKLLPAKMAWWKMRGKDAMALRDQAKSKEDIMKVLTEDERKKMIETAFKNNGWTGDYDDYVKGQMPVSQAAGYLKDIDKDIEDKNKDIRAIDAQIKKGVSTRKRAELTDQRARIESEVSDLESRYSTLKTAVDTATAAGSSDLDFTKLKAEITPYFNNDALTQLQTDLSKDDALRAKLGLYDKSGDFDKDKYKELKDEYNKLIQLAGDRDWKDNPSDRADRAARVKKAGEAWEDVDDRDALIEGYQQALKDNNENLAIYIAQKMSKAGMGEDLLKAQGFENNVEGLAAMIHKDLKSLSYVARANTGIQLSSLNAANGNESLGGSVHVTGPNGREFKSLERQQKDSKALFTKKSVTERSKGAYAHTIKDSTGKVVTESNNGIIADLNAHTGDEGRKKIKRMDPGKAQFVLDMSDANKISPEVRGYLMEAAGRKRK